MSQGKDPGCLTDKVGSEPGGSLAAGGFSRDKDCNSLGVEEVRAVTSRQKASVESHGTHYMGKNLNVEV